MALSVPREEMGQPSPEMSEQRLKEILGYKKDIKKDLEKLGKHFSKMIEKGEKEFKKDKHTDAIVTDWQTHYENFAEAILSNDIDRAAEEIDLLLAEIELDIAMRYGLYKSVSVVKWHQPAQDLVREMKSIVEKLKQYSDKELQRVPMFLELKEFEKTKTWNEITELRKKSLDVKEKEQEKIERAKILQNALLMQESLDEYEKLLSEKEGEVPKSDLEMELDEELRKLKIRVLDELDRFYEAVQAGEEYEMSVDKTMPGVLMQIKQREKMPKEKPIPREISEAETIYPSVYEKDKNKKPRRKAG